MGNLLIAVCSPIGTLERALPQLIPFALGFTRILSFRRGGRGALVLFLADNAHTHFAGVNKAQPGPRLVDDVIVIVPSPDLQVQFSLPLTQLFRFILQAHQLAGRGIVVAQSPHKRNEGDQQDYHGEGLKENSDAYSLLSFGVSARICRARHA